MEQGSTRRRSRVVARRELLRRILRARKAAGLTQRSAATAVGWSLRKQTAIESDETVLSRDDLERMLPAFEIAPDERQEWFELVDEAGRTGWWDVYGDEDLPPTSKRFIGFEHGARHIRSFEPLVIHGLTQTAAYREAIVRDAAVGPRPAEQVAALLEVSRRRQELLHGADPLDLWVVFDEAALHRRVGEGQVMSEQLHHVADLAEQLDNVKAQVIPFDAGPHAGLGGSFSLFEFGWPDDAGFVYLESGPDETTYLEDRAKVYRYSQLFDRLSQLALQPEQSLQMLRDVARRSGTRKVRRHD